MTAAFQPQVITTGQQALLTISTAADQPLGTTALEVRASAQVDGLEVSDSVDLSLVVQPVTTSFMGRAVIDDPLQTPLGGVTVTLLGRDGNGNPTGCVGQTVTDAARNFSFRNLPVDCEDDQLIR